MRVVYSCCIYLLLPFIFLRLLWRSIKAPEYRNRCLERLAVYQKKSPQAVIWFHAVSVGEVEAVLPLIRQIQAAHPNLKLLITTTTPTGSARVQAALSESVGHVYLPYDLPDAVARFMHHFQPRLAVIMETELWPNLYAACRERQIPLYLINARLSEKSVRGYRKLESLVKPALAAVKLIATQSEQDRERFLAIGANSDKLIALGNIKFDVDIVAGISEQGEQLKASLFASRYVWLLASTHKDEENLFFDSYLQLKQQIPELLLVIAPRHPERFPDVKKACTQANLMVATRTLGQTCTPATDVYLADTLGELKMLYAAADVAFVGGSMVPTGGHNVLEAAAIGVPILFGPHMFNFKAIAAGILASDAAIQCHNQTEIMSAIIRLYQYNDYRKQLISNGKNFILKNQGVTAKIMAMLASHLN